MAEKKKTAKKTTAKKTKQIAKKTNLGRPTVMTGALLEKLKLGFSMGLNDRECSRYAEINPQTLYNYCRKNPEFLEQKELLKKDTSIIAKTNVHKAIKKGDTELSKWYLERKNKDEFSTKQDVGVTGNINNPFEGLTTEELKKLIKDE